MKPFDAVAIVDWSAAATPKRGADSVWWTLQRAEASAPERLENPETRAAAMADLAALALEESAAGRRLLIGFDFPFGYPVGAAAAFAGRAEWRALWALLAAEIVDGPDNANNRFEVADRLNRAAYDGAGPFWGRPPRPPRAGPPPKKPSGYGVRYPAERRAVERRLRATQPVWKLYTAGSVGGQALMGVAALERFRRAPGLAGRVAVWPFETGFGAGVAPIVLAEVYPSLWPPDPRYAVKDAGQVVATAAALAVPGALQTALAAPGASGEERAAAMREEAWILGAFWDGSDEPL